MNSFLPRTAFTALLVAGVGVAAQTQTAQARVDATHAVAGAGAAASAPAKEKKKRSSRAKTPPGKPPRGVAECNQGDKAQQQRCLHDMYGAGGPRI